MTFASRPAIKENLRPRNDSSNEFLARSNVDQQRVSHSFCRAPRSFQTRSPTSLTLVPTSSALVPNSPPTSLTLVSTSSSRSFQIRKLTVAIDRGHATTVLSEHHNKEQRKRTQWLRVSALCPARNFRSRSNQTMGCAHTWMIIVHVVLRLYTRCQRRLKKTESNKCSAVAMWMVKHKHCGLPFAHESNHNEIENCVFNKRDL